MRPAIVVAFFLAAAPAVTFGSVTRARYLMGTICEITVPDSARATEQIDAAFAEAARVENFLSTWRDDSELSRVNRGQPGPLSTELYQLLEIAVSWSRRTDGAFNPLVRPLIDLWQTRGDGKVPDADAIRAAEAKTAIDNIRFDHGTIALANGARVEEGAFGKGYAIDRMLGVLRSEGAVGALINFGGQLAAYGDPREASIADPLRRDRPLVPLMLQDASLSTSSGAERSFVAGGRRFTHIIDPRSGEALPPRGSVSVLHPSALVADILSTALYVMGPDEGMRWARAHDVNAIFVTETRQIIRQGRRFDGKSNVPFRKDPRISQKEHDLGNEPIRCSPHHRSSGDPPIALTPRRDVNHPPPVTFRSGDFGKECDPCVVETMSQLEISP